MAIATPPGVPPRKERPKKIYYPVSDGKPMAETDKHADQMVYCKESLRAYFAHRPEVYISGNNFLYYEEGNPKAVISPDCYVVFGVGNQQRDCYKVWEEGGKRPDVVIEITSRSTRRADEVTKHPLYEQVLKVPEYFLFDPTGDYLHPRLQGNRLQNGVYVALELVNNRLFSEQLGLELVVEGDRLRFYDPTTGEWLLSMEEALAARRAAEQRAEEEAAARAGEARRAEEEAAARAGEARRAEAEAQQAREATLRAEAEAQRANAAEAENARLRAELETLQQKNRP